MLIALLAAALASYGTYLAYTAIAFGWSGVRPLPATGRASRRRGLRVWLEQAGLEQGRARESAAAAGLLFVFAAAFAYAMFGGIGPALGAGAFASTAPLAASRQRRARGIAKAHEAWPRLLEELRLLTGSLGRSIPQALFEAGKHAPEQLRPAFAAAEREWLLTTDFEKTVAVLEERLDDPAADAIGETLLVAHEVGGRDVDRQLKELIAERLLDLEGRKEAQSKQAGVRFARRFVLLVPLGMAAAGLLIGTGRSAYESPGGQVAVLFAIVAVAACWVWSGRLLRLPREPRTFATAPAARDVTLYPKHSQPRKVAAREGEVNP